MRWPIAVKVGGQKSGVVFDVAPKLSIKIILGTVLDDNKTPSRRIIPEEGQAVAIAKSFKDEDAA